MSTRRPAVKLTKAEPTTTTVASTPAVASTSTAVPAAPSSPSPVVIPAVQPVPVPAVTLPSLPSIPTVILPPSNEDEEEEVEDDKKKRKDSNEQTRILGIPSTRVRSHIDKFGVNAAFMNLNKTVKLELTDHDLAKKALESGMETTKVKSEDSDGKKKMVPTSVPLTDERRAYYQSLLLTDAEYAQKTMIKNAISKSRIRFTNNVEVHLAAVGGYLVRELLTYAANNTLKNEKLNIKLKHLYKFTVTGDAISGYQAESDIHQQTFYSLIKGLPSFNREMEFYKAEALKQKFSTELSKAVKEAVQPLNRKIKTLQKKLNDTEEEHKVEEKHVVEAKVPKVEKPSAEERLKNKYQFTHYIAQINKALQASGEYKTVRISDAIKNHIHVLLADFFHKIADIVRPIVIVTEKKTVSEKLIVATIESFFQSEMSDFVIKFDNATKFDPKKEKELRDQAKKEDRKVTTEELEALPKVSYLVADVIRNNHKYTAFMTDISKVLADHKQVKTA